MSQNFTIYRSSAGSGKTHTLVKEYIKLAVTGRDYAKRFARILAITFTNKAAEEMKERVIQNLFSLQAPVGHYAHNASYLDEMVAFTGIGPQELSLRAGLVFTTMLHNYHLLKITTIDKFTVSLVYSFARDLEIDADHEIVTDANEIIDEGVAQLIEQSGKDADLTKMFVDFLGFELDEGNKFNAHRELKKFCTKVLDEKGYEALGVAQQYSEEEFLNACKIASAKIAAVDNHVHELVNTALKRIKQAGLTADDFYQKGKGNLSWLIKISKDGFAAIQPATRVDEFIAGKRWQKKLSPEKEQATARIEDDLVSIIQQLLTVKSKESRNYIVHKTVRQNGFSMALFKRLHEVILTHKQHNNIVLLSEFTKMVSDIVAAEPAPFIYERLGERVKNIFVDEFQDTSSMQFSNIVPLMENSLATNDFVMLVGDAKQSIYRWRNGNVEQFVNLPALPETVTAQHPYRQKLFNNQFLEKKLPVNYRSLGNVVSFNNLFFENIIRSPELNTAALQLAYKDVAQNAVSTKHGGFVRFEIGEKASTTQNDEEEQANIPAIDFTLRAIEQCIQNGGAFADVAILVRTHKEGELIFNALRKKGIPVVSNNALGLAHSGELKCLMDFYMLMQYKQQHVRLKQFVFTYATYKGSVHELEPVIAGIGHNQTLAWEKVLEHLQIPFEIGTYERLSLFEQLHYIAHCLSIPLDNAFVAAFFELVFGFYRKHGSNANMFMDWWLAKSTSLTLQTASNENSVQIVTIHKSKGLQYKVVIVPFVSAKMGTSDKYFWLYDVPGYSIKPLPVQYGKQLGDTDWNNQYEEEKEKSAFDWVNLLYVAFTRAEEQLYCHMQVAERERANNIVLQALEQIGNGIQNNVFEYGQLVVSTKKSKQTTALTAVKATKHPVFSPWYDKLQVSTHTRYNEKSEMNARDKGVLFHAMAAHIHGTGNIKEVVHRFVQAGKIPFENADDLTKDLESFYESSHYLALKERAEYVLSEIEMSTAAGEVKRPDKLFITKTGIASIVDIKTGVTEPEHGNQVKEYMAILKQAGYTEGENWLYYVKNNTWIKVD